MMDCKQDTTCTSSSEDSAGFPEPPHVARAAGADSHPRPGTAFAQQAQSQSNSPASKSSGKNRSNPSRVGGKSLIRKSRHIPTDITQYSALSRNDSTTFSRLGQETPNLPKIHSLDDKDEETVTPKVKRHVPIVIPAFAHPFVKDLTKPPFQPTVQAWPAPKLRREARQLAPSSVGVDLHAHSLHDLTATPTSSINEIADDMNMSQANQSMVETMRNVQEGSPESAAVQPGPNAVSSSMSQQIDSTGPTNLSGLVCNVHRTTGKEPHALVGATTTILGDRLYVFGGRILSRRRPHLTSDLYELDLIRRHWSKLETFGESPPPRYFHTVCALGDTKLVCYGGMSPANYPKSAALQSEDSQAEVIVMSDIHIYDVPTRTWMFIPTPDNPQGRYAHCATILPSSATFASPTAPFSAIQHNPSSSNPHSGSIGMKLDGAGGAEMVVVGGQDSANHYIEQISVFNLRSLQWTATNSVGRQCGAYRSVVTPLTGMPVSAIGRVARNGEDADESTPETGSSTLIYSNYNFLDVRLELQIRHPDGRLNEKFMGGAISPPGLRFPNGGIVDHHFVVSGTYLTSSKQEYALWALDLRNLTWGRIDAGGAVFGQGSWNRGVLWNRRNTFVILGHRKRSLVEDYNQRRINFSHVCMVELEAFGLYDNPRKAGPFSGYVSVSAPPCIPASMSPKAAGQAVIRPLSGAAESLGQLALGLKEMADMDLLAIGGERIPVNSHLLSQRWGPYFNRLLRDSSAGRDGLADVLSLRPHMNPQASRNSSITITPSLGQASNYSTATTLNADSSTAPAPDAARSAMSQGALANSDPPDTIHLLPSTRPRTLYLPHTPQTLRLMLHYLYTSSLPPITSLLCTPQILCSVLQLARPYEIDGLLEATVERLHEVLDGRNAAAVFNASAMAAGGGRGLESMAGYGVGRRPSEAGTINGNMGAARDNVSGRTLSTKTAGLRINTSFGESAAAVARSRSIGHQRSQSEESAASNSTAASVATSVSDADAQSESQRESCKGKEVWTGDVSSVIGLQKRGLRGLMEGRRLRERGNTTSNPSFNAAPAGQVGINGGTGAG